LNDAALWRYGQDKSADILRAMEKAGDDVVTGRITPEQSDIDIGRLLDALKHIQHEVETEQERRSRKKRNLHRTMLMTISLLAAGFFYFVFSY
jgi:hypothetical protein